MMSFRRFLIRMIGVLTAFATVSYLTTHSPWTTFVHTLLCALLIQVGYFGAILVRVYRDRRTTPDTAVMSTGKPDFKERPRKVSAGRKL
jgi:exopolysaccharide production repressor protein